MVQQIELISQEVLEKTKEITCKMGLGWLTRVCHNMQVHNAARAFFGSLNFSMNFRHLHLGK